MSVTTASPPMNSPSVIPAAQLQSTPPASDAISGQINASHGFCPRGATPGWTSLGIASTMKSNWFMPPGGTDGVRLSRAIVPFVPSTLLLLRPRRGHVLVLFLQLVDHAL